MVIETIAAKRAKTHQRYYDKAGTMLPGVTTILGVLNKPALVPWANKLGLAGIDVKDYVDALAMVGSLAHELILCHHHGKLFVPDGRSPDLIDAAENCLLKYFQWEKGHKVEPILCEAMLVSEKYKYGGTVDLYCKIDGVPTVVDYKSGRAIYPEMVYQASAYRQLLEENGHKVDAVRILQIGRDEKEGFSEKTLSDTSREVEIFMHCLALYQLMKTK